MRLWICIGVGAVLVGLSGLVSTMASAQQTADPNAVIGGFENARNRRDLDASVRFVQKPAHDYPDATAGEEVQASFASALQASPSNVSNNTISVSNSFTNGEAIGYESPTPVGFSRGSVNVSVDSSGKASPGRFSFSSSWARRSSAASSSGRQPRAWR